MKKVIIGIISLILIAGILIFVYFDKPKDIPIPKPEEEVPKEVEEIDSYVDDNKIVLGLYKNYRNGKNRMLIKEYESTWSYHNDISSFEVYYTNEEEISNKNQIQLFDEYKDNYSNPLNYKIGYYISFDTYNEHIQKTILRPKDSEDFFKYLEIYLYDDYHRSGGWYSHTTDEEYNEETLLTSIKLTAGVQVNDIISDITLMAFTYDADDFDENNNYRGVSKYTITIKNNMA